MPNEPTPNLELAKHGLEIEITINITQFGKHIDIIPEPAVIAIQIENQRAIHSPLLRRHGLKIQVRQKSIRLKTHVFWLLPRHLENSQQYACPD
jgi:hypothetical protein